MSPPVRIRECGEPLVDVPSTSPLRVDPHPAAPTQPSIRLRSGLVDRLVLAQSLLPRRLRLLIVAGHLPTPGHASGGAVDLRLAQAGAELEEVAQNQQLLAEALTASGLVNLPGRWWHWSHGDAEWAEMTGAGEARYGPV